MASMSQFNDLIDYFRTKYNIVAFDMLGCGESSKPIDPFFSFEESFYSTKNLLLDAEEIFNRYATSSNVLIGHSFGTSLVCKLINVLESKHATGKSVILCSVLLSTKLLFEGGPPSIFYLPVWVLDLMQDYLSRQFTLIAYSPTCDEAIIQRSRNTSNANKMYVCKAFYLNFVWANENEWRAMTNLPTLICQGNHDLITPCDGIEAFKEILNDCTIEIIENAGHQVMQEKPVEIISHIEKFVQAHILM
jgi:pimeloyl-ACP methyl ester carboxylesterase